MPVTLGGQPEHGFDQPLGLLSDCHRRIERFLNIILTVVERTQPGTQPENQPGDQRGNQPENERGNQPGHRPLNADEHRALLAALDYFATAAPRHTDDEEHSLFPRLRQCRDREAHAAMARIDALQADHRKADALHEQVAQLCHRWLDAHQPDAATQLASHPASQPVEPPPAPPTPPAPLTPNDFDHLHSMLTELRDLYAQHIAIEDHEVFPLAQRLLSETDLTHIGNEMAQRRGFDSSKRESDSCLR